jgi:hypothetical protein
MKHISLVLFILIFGSSFLDAQIQQRSPYGSRNRRATTEKRDTTDKQSLKDKITYGGNASAAYASGWFLELMPVIGYRATHRLTVGIGPSFAYRSFMYVIDPITTSNSGYVINGNSIWGGRVFASFNVFRQFFVRGEIEELRIPYGKVDPSGMNYIESSRFVPATLLGIGMRQPITEKAYSYFVFMYDLTYDPVYSYQQSPLRISVGFMF